MARQRRKPIPTVQITVTTTVPIPCATCQAPATGRVDVDQGVPFYLGEPLYLCDACYRAWQSAAPGDAGGLIELRG